MKKTNSCSISKPTAIGAAGAKQTETDLWKDMMESMVKFTEASMDLMKSMQDKFGNAPSGVESGVEICKPCGFTEKQKKSTSEQQPITDFKTSSTVEVVDKSSSSDFLAAGIECHQPPRIIKKKKYKYSSDIQNKILSQMKRVPACQCNDEMNNQDIDTCLCGKIPETVELLDSTDKDITVCSGLQTDEILNIKCLGKTVGTESAEKDAADTETLQPETETDELLPPWVYKPGSDPDALPQDDNHPFMLKGGDEIEIPDQLLGVEIFNTMKNFPEKIAQIDHASEVEETYEEFLRKCVAVAINLRKEFSKNDIVGLCTNNHKNRSIPYIAALFNGNRVVGFHRHMTEAENSHCLKNVTPSIMFVSSDSLSDMEKSMQNAGVSFKIVLFDGESNYSNLDSYLEVDEDETQNFEPYKENSSDSTAVICFTSGITELPKAVCLSHFGILRQCLHLKDYENVPRVILNFAEIDHISCILILLSSILNGSTRVVVDKFQISNIWKLVEKYKINSIYLHPHHCVELSTCPEPTENTSTLFNIITSGERLSSKVTNRLREILLGAFIFRLYGCTEMYGITTIFRLSKTEDHAFLYFNYNSCGKPMKGNLYKVVNVKTGMMLNYYCTGELHVRTETTHNGFYVDNKEESKPESKWINTGDLAYYDYYSCFHLVGRSEYLINCQNEIIIPHLIEDILMSHPSVETAIVLGIPHDQDGQHPIAFVKFGKTDVDLNVLEKMVQEKGYQLQGGLKIIKDIPQTDKGKIRRDAILQSFLKGEI